MVNWTNYKGRHGIWIAIIHGQRLRINYIPIDVSGEGMHYRIRTSYSNEMFEHQFYRTLKEAKEAAETMLTKHLKERETQGLKVDWNK